MLNKSFEYTPCNTTYTEQFVLFKDDEFDFNSGENVKDINSKDVDQKENHKNNEKEDSDKEDNEDNNTTESEYEFSDVDEDETKVVNEIMAKSMCKLKRHRQTKQYIHITTTY